MALARRKRKDIVLSGVELAGKHSLIFFKTCAHVCLHACTYAYCVCGGKDNVKY